MSQTLSMSNRMIVSDFLRFLKHNGYSSEENNISASGTSNQGEIIVLPPNDPNPVIRLYQHPQKRTLIVEMVGNPWSFMIELSLRYFKELGVNPKLIQVLSLSSEGERILFEVDSITNPIFSIQQRLKERNEVINDVKLVIQMSAVSSSVKSAQPILKPGKHLVKTLKKRSHLAPSQVMFKRRKLSQLTKRDIAEPETPIIAPLKPPPDPEVLFNIPIMDELSEPEQIILKEILKRPKKKVQSNHIAKKVPKFDQDLIRQVLRQLVDKGVLRVSSGWYILKKSPSKTDEQKEPVAKTKKKSTKYRKKKRSSKRGKRRRSSKKSIKITDELLEEENYNELKRKNKSTTNRPLDNGEEVRFEEGLYDNSK